MKLLVIQHDHASPLGHVAERFVERGFDLTMHTVVPEESFATPGVTWTGFYLSSVIGSIPMRLGINRTRRSCKVPALIWEILAPSKGPIEGRGDAPQKR